MKRIRLLTALLGLAGAQAANASSVILATDTLYPLWGQVITLSVYVTATSGETDNGVFGGIVFDASMVEPATQTQYELPPGDWTQGALSCTATRCVAFSQIRQSGATAIGVVNFLIAELTFTVRSPSPDPLVFGFSWQTTPSTQRLDFFGITNAPGVAISFIPEPTPAALFGLGLAGLALARRARG